jgi:hypothetical protein
MKVSIVDLRIPSRAKLNCQLFESFIPLAMRNLEAIWVRPGLDKKMAERSAVGMSGGGL